MTMEEQLKSREWGSEFVGMEVITSLAVLSNLGDKMICKGLSPGRIPNAAENSSKLVRL
jgi:hypothetical protein